VTENLSTKNYWLRPPAVARSKWSHTEDTTTENTPVFAPTSVLLKMNTARN